MSWKLCVIAGAACLFTICSTPIYATDLSNTIAGSVSDGTATIPYRLFEPQGVAPGQKVPLILFLQGMGDRGTDNVSQTYWMDQLAQHTRSGQYAAYVLAPQLDTNMWFATTADQPTEGMSLTMQALAQEMKDPNVDTSRVYVTGLSMGAFGVWDILRRQPKTFAAAVPLSGGWDPSTVSIYKDVPIWAFHGSADSVVPVQTTRDMIQALRDAGGSPLYTEIPGGDHVIWPQVYADAGNTLYPWLFSQQLAGSEDTGAAFSAPVLTPVVATAPVAVDLPEPTSLGLIAVVGIALLRRGRRKKNRSNC